MINNFKKPNLNAPRYRDKRLGLLNYETIKEFKDKKPLYSKIDNSKLKQIIKTYNIKLWKAVIENRDGVELPDSLGFLFIGKIFYTNWSTKYRFKNRELWHFVACRDFKRAVAKEYPKKWTQYVIMKNKYRVAHLYDPNIEETNKQLKYYNEFET